MATPANRVPVRIARGSKANLDTAIAAGDLKEGEICYATDENGIYVVEGGTLTQAGADLAATSIDALSDVDTSTVAPADGQALIWDNAAQKWEPGAAGAVDSVNTQTGAVSLGVEDLDDFQLQATPPVSSYNAAKQSDGDFTNTGNTAGGFALDTSGGIYSKIYINKNNPTSGTSLASQGFTAGTNLDLWVSADGVTFTQHTATNSFDQGSNNAYFSGLSPDLSAYTSASALYFSLTSAAGTPIALADGDMLQYESASSKFRPVQLGVDNLSDVDTSTVAPVDGQALVWDNANSKWEPGGVSGEIEWTLTANGTTDYIFAGAGFAGTETDPAIYVMRGQTYKFTNGMGAHPFQIQSTQGTSGTAYNDGITNNAVSNGTLTWEVRMDAPSTLYYQCTSHALMAGVIHVLDEGSAVASIDDLSDVDTSTVAPTDGQALVWDNANSKWEPGTVSGGGGTTLPSGTTDGEALIWENGAWAVGPAIGGVDYFQGSTISSNYTAPTGFSYWTDTFVLRDPSNATLSNNNLTATCGSSETQAYSSSSKSSGLWYWEISIDGGTDNNAWFGMGVNVNYWVGSTNSGGISINGSGQIANNTGGTTISSVSSHVAGDVRMFALDADNKKLWIGKNGTWENSGDPAAGTGEVLHSWTGSPDWLFICRLENTNSGWGNTIQVTGSPGTQVTIPYSIDKLDDVDTSTVAPTDGQALVWDNANSKWEPGTVGGSVASIDDIGDVDTSTTAPTNGQVLTWDGSQWEPATPTVSGLPSANDGEALIYENGQWVPGPVIGGVDYLPSTSDANFSNVELLLLGNGANGSTTFTDSSSNARTATVSGNTQISTTQSKFGGASIYFDGTGDYLEFAADTNLIDWHTGGAFTVEAWVYADSWTNWSVNSSLPSLCGNSDATGNVGYWTFGPNTSGNIVFQYFNGGTVATTGATALTTGAWHHIAMSYDGTTIKVFADGVLDASSTVSGTPQTSLSYNFTVGSLDNKFITGYVDDLRITQGVARYTATFTPPTAELPTASGTITIPYSIDKLDDVDTSTVAPTDGQALVWDNAAGKWEPGTVSGGGGTTLPSGTADGEALIWEDGAWAIGPVIGGVDYTPSATPVSNSTPPTGFSLWDDSFTTGVTNVTYSNSDRTATADNSSEKSVWSTVAKNSGKWYVEFSLGNISSDMVIGFTQTSSNAIAGVSPSTGFGIRQGGSSFNQLSGATIDAGYSNAWGYTNYVMFAIDFDAKKVWFGVDGTWQNSGDPAAGTGYVISNWSGTPSYYVGGRVYNTSESITWETYIPSTTPVTIPYSIDKLDDVDTSTVAPTDGQALLWDNAAQKWEPGSLGVEDLDDFALNTVAPTSTWTNPNTGNPPANSWRFINNSGSARLSTTSSSGYEKDDLLARLTLGANVTITIGGVDHVGTVSAAAFLDDAGTSVEDVHVGFSLTPTPATTTLSDGPMTLSYDDISTTDVPLADGDILQYNSTDSKFKPAQLGVDDLSDVDTTTVAPTDGQALVWDNAAGKWEPGTVSGGGGGMSRAQATAITLLFS